MNYKYETLKGCLCWFWNNKETGIKLGVLADYYNDEDYQEQLTFYELNGGSFSHCEPVKDGEFTLYADKDCVTSSRRKAKKKLADKIEEILEENIEFYKEEYKNNQNVRYIDAAEQDLLHISCLEDKDVVDLTKKLMETM